jgi:hypothetical protein
VPVIAANSRMGIPAATSSAASVKPTTSAVPRSGCDAISRHAAPATTTSGLAISLSDITIRGLLASRWTAYSTSASFMSSEGWNCTGPAPIQRRAPLISTPIPGIFTSTRSTNATPSSGGVSRRTASRRMRDAAWSATKPIVPYTRYLTRYAVPSPWPCSSVRALEAL